MSNIVDFPKHSQDIPDDLVKRLWYWDKIASETANIPRGESDLAAAALRIISLAQTNKGLQENHDILAAHIQKLCSLLKTLETNLNGAQKEWEGQMLKIKNLSLQTTQLIALISHILDHTDRNQLDGMVSPSYEEIKEYLRIVKNENG